MSVSVGICACSNQAQREELEAGWLSSWADRLPFICEACAQAADAREDALERERLDDQRRQHVHRALRRLPAKLRNWSLDDLDTNAGRHKALDAARRWAAGELLGLVLVGGIGVGKTTIAAAAVRGRVEHGSMVRWLNTAGAISDLGRNFNDNRRLAALDALTGSGGALVLDDIDKALPNRYATEQIFLAVDNSVTNDRSLLITSNLMPSQLAAHWPAPSGEAIASRLAGYCEIHQIVGNDRRLA